MLGGMRETQCARAREGAHRQVAVVAPAQELRQRDAAHRRCGRRRGARDGREHGAAEHVDVQQPAWQARRPWRQSGEERSREARVKQDLRHQDEKRERDELGRGGRIPGELRQQLLDRQAAEDGEAGQTGRIEREPHPHPGTEDQGEDAENGAGGGDGHGFILRRSPAWPLRPPAARQRADAPPGPRAEA